MNELDSQPLHDVETENAPGYISDVTDVEVQASSSDVMQAIEAVTASVGLVNEKNVSIFTDEEIEGEYSKANAVPQNVVCNYR